MLCTCHCISAHSTAAECVLPRRIFCAVHGCAQWCHLLFFSNTILSINISLNMSCRHLMFSEHKVTPSRTCYVDKRVVAVDVAVIQVYRNGVLTHSIIPIIYRCEMFIDYQISMEWHVLCGCRDSQGKFRYTPEAIPDAITKYHITMAAMHPEKGLGMAFSTLTVTTPLQVRTIVPYSVTVQEDFTVRCTVHHFGSDRLVVSCMLFMFRVSADRLLLSNGETLVCCHLLLTLFGTCLLFCVPSVMFIAFRAICAYLDQDALSAANCGILDSKPYRCFQVEAFGDRCMPLVHRQ